MKNIVTKSAILLAGALMLSNTLLAKEETTLIIHHHMSSKAPTHTKLLEPWAKKIEEATKGKVKVEVMPSMTLGGKPNELYKQVRDGSIDIAWTIAGYTPGVFPRTEVFELPTVHKGDSLATTLAIRDNFYLIQDDYKDVVPLLIHVNAGNALHTTVKKVEKAEDVKGLKLRTPSRTGAWFIEELGAEPVGMPLPAVPQALSKNAVDGIYIPFEVFPPYKLQQLTKYSAEGVNGERFGASVFLMLMNKDKFNSLSKDVQDIILENSGLDFAKLAGELFMDIENPGKSLQLKSGGEIVKFTPEVLADFDKAGQKVVEKWISESKEKGIDGQKLVDEARKAINKYSK